MRVNNDILMIMLFAKRKIDTVYTLLFVLLS